MTSAASPLLPDDPRALGSYTLLGRLGEGGMGVVYLGVDPQGQRVAIKAIHRAFSSHPEFVVRFHREVAAARRVPRFCTAAVLEAVLETHPPYLVTEYIDGPDLAGSVAASGPLAGADLNALAVGIAAALTAIHDAGVVHRDLKPSNVLLSAAGPRVIDFGIARAADATAHTLTGQVLGTPAYMAPEQIGGDRATAATDVFAWGGVVAFAASGEGPFGPTSSVPAIMHRILHESPRLDRLESGLRRIVAMAMDKDPDRRPTSRDLLARLVEYADAAAAGRSRAAEVIQQASVTVPAPPSQEWAGLATTAPPPSGPPPTAPAPPPTVPPGPDTTGRPRTRRGRAPVAVMAAAAVTLVLAIGTAAVADPFGWRGSDPGGDSQQGQSSSPSGSPGGEVTPFELKDVRGQAATAARAELVAAGLDIRMEARESGEDERARVLDIDPAPGTTVVAGDTVVLYVGDGSLVETRDWLVFKRADSGSPINVAPIVVVSPDGKERVVGEGDSPDVTADGRRVAYVATGSGGSAQIVTASRNGKDRRRVTAVTAGSVNALAWAPDGRRLAYVNNTGGLFVINADGSGRRLVADVDGFELAWSPDGRQIVFRRWDVTPQQIWIVAADGGGLRALDIAFRRGVDDPIPTDASWSPDGKRIVFGDFRGGIYTIGSDGRGMRKLVSGGFYPSWTPDGDIAYVRGSTAYTIAPDGTGEQVLPGIAPAGPVQWGREP